MLTDQLKQDIRQFVTELLDQHNPPVRKEDQQSYVESLQFSLAGKSEKGHQHVHADIKDRFPSLALIVRREGENIVMEVTVSKVRGYCMGGALIGVMAQSLNPENASKPMHTDSRQFINGELLYKFTLPDNVRNAMPIKVLAFMRDLNDPEVDVRTDVRILSVGKLQGSINEQTL